jgi:hypothetical protein
VIQGTTHTTDFILLRKHCILAVSSGVVSHSYLDGQISQIQLFEIEKKRAVAQSHIVQGPRMLGHPSPRMETAYEDRVISAMKGAASIACSDLGGQA